MSMLRYYGLTPEEADAHGITHQDGKIMDGHHRAAAAMKDLVAPAPHGTFCDDCGVRRAEFMVDTQRAEGRYCMCGICAFHSVKNRGMRYVRKTELAGEADPASLAAPGSRPSDQRAREDTGNHRKHEQND